MFPAGVSVDVLRTPNHHVWQRRTPVPIRALAREDADIHVHSIAILDPARPVKSRLQCRAIAESTSSHSAARTDREDQAFKLRQTSPAANCVDAALDAATIHAQTSAIRVNASRASFARSRVATVERKKESWAAEKASRRIAWLSRMRRWISGPDDSLVRRYARGASAHEGPTISILICNA